MEKEQESVELTLEELTKLIDDIKSGAVKYEDPPNIIIYDDFNKMMVEMKEYVSLTQHKLAIQDQPQQLRVGFIDSVDESKWFVIGVDALKRWQDKIREAEPNKVELIKKAMSSQAGKETLLRIINGE